MKTISKMGFALLALLLGSTGWGQTSFGKYGPVNGIQMNTGATPYNFAAGITDIQSLLSASPGVVLAGAAGGAKGVGTINATALYINGAAVGTSSGAVSSVGLTAPTCFGVTGSPVTAAGSLGLTLGGTKANMVLADGTCGNNIIAAAATTGLTITGSAAGDQLFGECNSTNSANLRCWSQRVGSGANGAWALQPALDNGTLGNNAIVITRDTSANVTGLFFNDTSNNAPATFQGTGTVTMGGSLAVTNNESIGGATGLTITTGNLIVSAGTGAFHGFVDTSNDTGGAFRARNTAGTFAGQVGNDHSWTSGGSTTDFGVGSAGLMHFYTNNSATPFLTAATTGAVTIAAPSSGTALSVTGLANNTALQVTAPATSGQSYGITVQAGTTSADWGLDVNNAAGVSKFQVRGDGSGFFGPSGASSLSISAAGNVAIGAPSSGTGLAVLGVANGNAQTIQSPNTTSQSFGLFITAGTNSTDYTLAANTAAGAAAYRFFGDGGLVMGSPTGGDKGVGSINTQSLYVNGVAATIPQLMTWFTINTSAGGCTLAVNHSSANAGSCVRNSAGNYDVTTPTSYPSNLLPACSASGNTVTGWELFSAPIAVNLISIDAYFNGVGADGQSIEVICIG